MLNVDALVVWQVSTEMGMSLEEFLARYTEMLLQVQKTYGLDSPTLSFNLSDMEKFLARTASEALTDIY